MGRSLKYCVYAAEPAAQAAPWLPLPPGKGIPWHRVLGEGGKILVREPYASLQKKLLESEGVTVIESRVNLKQYLWNLQDAKSKPRPARETEVNPQTYSQIGESVREAFPVDAPLSGGRGLEHTV